jgi:hypothetical protein
VGAGCHRWYTKGGSVKREAEVVHATDEDVGAARGVGGVPGLRVPWAGARVARAAASRPRVVRRQAPKYPQWKKSWVEKSGEPQDWTRRMSPSRRGWVGEGKGEG